MPPESPKKAVLCDDDKTTTLILRRLLGKLGFSVFIGNNGDEGLSLVRSEKPQLLVLDLDMPVKNGVAVLEELKNDQAVSPYTIVLSAHESKEEHDQMKNLGAKDFLIKPFNPLDLMKKVEQLVKEGQL